MRSTAIQGTAVPWHHVGWLGLCLLLLQFFSSVTPTASGPMQAATINAYHGHTSTFFVVAWSPDGRRIASGGNDTTQKTLLFAVFESILEFDGRPLLSEGAQAMRSEDACLPHAPILLS